MRLMKSRMKCAYCLSIDIATLVLFFLALLNPIYYLPFSFAAGFAVIGIGDELLFQAKNYNYYSDTGLQRLQTLYFFIILALFIVFAILGTGEAIAYLVAIGFMYLLNKKRYNTEDPVAYDLVMILPFTLGILALFYA